jgi:hypothetical protein
MAVNTSPVAQKRPSLIPPFLQPRTFARAYATVLLFFVAALAGEWIVHQVQYLIEYGRQFGAVMALTPHQYYMGSAGAVLAAGALLALTATALALRLNTREYRRLRPLIPERLLQRIRPQPYSPATSGTILRTGLALAVTQIGIYLIQENLEAMAEGVPLPGLTAVLSSQHLTVLPLHLLVALCLAIVLWTVASLIGRSRAIVEQIRFLARLFGNHGPVRSDHPPVLQETPRWEFLTRSRSLRSPPLAA